MPTEQRGNRMHFDAVVDKYDAIRPSYPAELIADIFAYCGAGAGKNALEIGAGTGKATAEFLAAGYDVTAVEIGTDMSVLLQKRFAECNNFRVITSAFEDAKPLLDNAFDLVYAAAAFHWVDAKIACPKVLEILREGGTLAMFRYIALPSDGNPLYEEIQDVYKKYYHKPYKRPRRPTAAAHAEPAGIYDAFRCDPLEKYGFHDVTMKLYYTSHTRTTDEYMMMIDTFPDHQSLAKDDRLALYAGIRDAIERHGGHITVDRVFPLYMGRK